MPLDLRTSPRSAAALCALALAAGLACADTATAVGPTRAARNAATAAAPRPSSTPVRQPPTGMSDYGGARLGLSGVQVDPMAGAPAVPPNISALSWMVSDPDSGRVLAAKNPHWALPPASTLKTLFADTVLPKIPTGSTHKVLDSDLAGMGSGSSMVGVLPGHTYKVTDLWLGVFLRSGNDAVHVLAAMNGGVAETVRQMQARAVELGAGDTHVVSPDGYDMPGQVSSAFDLSLFARDGLKNADFARYCSTFKSEFPGGPYTKNKPFEIDNTDRMLGGIDGVPRYPGLIGVKNGYTTNAGNTLVVAAKRDGHTVLVTVMNPQDHATNAVYNEARELLDWGFAATDKVNPIGSMDATGTGTGAGADQSATAAPHAGAAHPPQNAAADTGGMGALGWGGLGLVGLAAMGGGVLLSRRRRMVRQLTDPLD